MSNIRSGRKVCMCVRVSVHIDKLERSFRAHVFLCDNTVCIPIPSNITDTDKNDIVWNLEKISLYDCVHEEAGDGTGETHMYDIEVKQQTHIGEIKPDSLFPAGLSVNTKLMIFNIM